MIYKTSKGEVISIQSKKPLSQEEVDHIAELLGDFLEVKEETE
jgi:TusA-related sulfurtransferase